MARRALQAAAGPWLPRRFEVAPGIFVTLRDKAIRDRLVGATRVVTVRVSSTA